VLGTEGTNFFPSWCLQSKYKETELRYIYITLDVHEIVSHSSPCCGGRIVTGRAETPSAMVVRESL
jgi:hypothetical protein